MQPIARAVPADHQIRDDRIALRLDDGADAFEAHLVPGDGKGLARSERPLRVHGPRLARRDGEGHQDDAEVNDIAAVTASVPAKEVGERRHPGLAVQRAPGTRAACELLHDRRDDERGERVREHRGDRGRPGEQRGDGPDRGGDGRRGELPLERRARGSVPGELRSDPHEEEEGECERDLDAVEVRSADRELRPRDRLGDEWVERPEQDGERRGHEDDVLEEEDRFA